METTTDKSTENLTSTTAPVEVSIRTLMDAGAHFGHQTQRWNPKMGPYIHSARNSIHIINLDLTHKMWARARKVIVDVSARGGSVLFVGTKRQARDIIKQEASRSDSYYVINRWLGGTLTNFETVRISIERMRRLEELLAKSEDPSSDVKISKKERLMITRDLDKLQASLGGIRNMRQLPSVLFVVDVTKESIAVAEARKLKIPVIGLVDTNSDPLNVDYVIPSNDDAVRSIKLFSQAVSDAALEGRASYNAQVGSRSDDLRAQDGGAARDRREARSERGERRDGSKEAREGRKEAPAPKTSTRRKKNSDNSGAAATEDVTPAA